MTRDSCWRGDVHFGASSLTHPSTVQWQCGIFPIALRCSVRILQHMFLNVYIWQTKRLSNKSSTITFQSLSALVVAGQTEEASVGLSSAIAVRYVCMYVCMLCCSTFVLHVKTVCLYACLSPILDVSTIRVLSDSHGSCYGWVSDRRCSRPGTANSLLYTVYSLTSRSSKCISTGSQNLAGASGRSSRLRSRGGAVHMFGLGDDFS